VKTAAAASLPEIMVRAAFTGYRKVDRTALPQECATFQYDGKSGEAAGTPKRQRARNLRARLV
jgi:hypothetical protein